MPIFTLLRPKQWVKNLLLFAPLIFAHELYGQYSFERSVLGFIAFCFFSSAVYIVNDIMDVDSDRKHPKKKNRPLANGSVLLIQASVMAVLLVVVGLGISQMIGGGFGLVALTYLLLLFSYSLKLKNLVIVDIMIVAVGFVLRAMAGAAAIQVEFSPWLLVTTLFLALFLVLGKRRHELLINNDTGYEHRPILKEYSKLMLDQMIGVVATASLVAFVLYSLWPTTIERFGTTNLVYTVPLVVYGLFRYFYLIYHRDGGGDPTESFYTDLPLLTSVVLWGIAIIAIIYT